ncbi:MAG: hypothetical protein R6X14_03940 [bacterium]
MKPRWLIVALAASLALNAGAIGAFAWHRYRRWNRERRFYRELKQDTRQRISVVLDEHRDEMDSLRHEYLDARRALALLGDEERPNQATLDSLLDRLAGVHREMNRVAFATGQEIFRMFPEQRRGMLRERWEGMRHRPDRHGYRYRPSRRDCGPDGPPSPPRRPWRERAPRDDR